MKTMLTLIAMLAMASAFASPQEQFDAIKQSLAYDAKADLQKYIERTQAEAAARPMVVVQEAPRPAVVTVMEVNPGVWKASDGSTIRDMGYLGYTISRP